MNALICELLAPAREHSFLRGLITLWVFSAAVSAMGAPGATSSQLYQWLYRFGHLLAANLDRSGLFETEPANLLGEAAKK